MKSFVKGKSRKTNPWLILGGMMSATALLSAALSGAVAYYVAKRVPGGRGLASNPNSSAVIADAERRGVFKRLNPAFRKIHGAISADGNVVVLEGQLAAYDEIEALVKAVEAEIGADSTFIIRPHKQVMDTISDRLLASRQGSFDYGTSARSVVILDLLRIDPEMMKKMPPPVPMPLEEGVMEQTLAR